MLAILYLTGKLELDISYFEHKKFLCISILTFSITHYAFLELLFEDFNTLNVFLQSTVVF